MYSFIKHEPHVMKTSHVMNLCPENEGKVTTTDMHVFYFKPSLQVGNEVRVLIAALKKSFIKTSLQRLLNIPTD